jgi:DNA-binding NarL/FixJ family response regulator
MIQIAICDDHRIVADGIRSLLRNKTEISVVGEAHNTNELIALLKKEKVDIVLMDIGLGKENGIDATAIILQQFPKVKVIALTMQNDFTSITEMRNAGASGYLLKNTSLEELCEAIFKVQEGRTFISREIKEILDKQIDGELPDSIKLTDREQAILIHLSNGLTTKEIADRILLSEDTVKWYRKNLLAKFEQPNVAALIKWAVLNKLIH